jgi:mannose-6-phosphate isomerase-like protein (cupin superfamily)
LKKGTGSEPPGENPAKNGGREVPVPFFQRAARRRRGEYHWHRHDREDEFFYVVEGRLLVDLEGRTVELLPQQGFVVPRGVLHRTRAPERTVILMVEPAGVVPTGDG